jgi:ribose transport system ATP-binding protein
VVVLRDGRTVAELPRDEISQDAIMTAMAHGASESNIPQESQHGED